MLKHGHTNLMYCLVCFNVTLWLYCAGVIKGWCATQPTNLARSLLLSFIQFSFTLSG